MKHPASQLPPLHTSPGPQLVPSGSFDQAAVELDGVHTWHPSLGSTVPDV
jgi:hypothetical protein